MKLPPGCWCFAREAGKAPTSWVDSYAETSLVRHGRGVWDNDSHPSPIPLLFRQDLRLCVVYYTQA
ncbi:hypothetical protein [Leptolyngbya sp. FACHB-16]|uniref:hypothetical protein n=1 Tax=unclassified Leptolyngbya TaxID=2650499 RepID=UPI001682C57D|nr:hypothetical protein [Leptolyngbya sp. FACHB-16]MBD2156811.1 hypothetical protein [Leptolyngbya sp. FACHB-16]